MEELWQIAKPFGRPAKFKSAKELWQAFIDYVEWSTNNPLVVNDTRSQKKHSLKEVAVRDEKSQYKQQVERPLTLGAFRLHANIRSEWTEFKAEYSKRNEDFSRVVYAIESAIRNQQVQNALVGNYKENLVARLNGISDTIKQEHSGNVNTRTQLSIADAQKIIQEVESKI